MGLDNQQERLTRLGWLAGIIDGEGSLSLSVIKGRHQTSIRPILRIVNTNKALIDEAFDIMKQEQIGVWRNDSYGKQKAMSNGRVWKSAEQLQVVGLRRLDRCLSILAPFLIAKKPQASVLQEFIRTRLSVTPDTPYGSYEFNLVAINRNLNATGENPQRLYVRQRSLPAKDIVRANSESVR